jgi:uncharacterized protein YegL
MWNKYRKGIIKMIIRKENKKMHVAIILDRSSSMTSIREATVKALNKQIETIHAEQREDVDVMTSFVTFSSDVDSPVFFDQPIKSLKKIRCEHYKPQGCTALNDAIGLTLVKLMGLPDQENTEFLVITVTDGDENNSKLFVKEVIKKMNERMCDKNQWTFAFLAANNPKSYFVDNYGAEEENVTIFEATNEGMEYASTSMSESISRFIRA